jgi:uncharacterized protein (TIGR03083 family)
MTHELDWIGFDLDGCCAAMTETTRDLVSVLRGIPATAAQERADGLEWSVAEVAAHLVALAQMYGAYLDGTRVALLDLENLAASNQQRIDEIRERDPAALANALEAGVPALTARLDGRDPLADSFWHGTDVPLGALAGILLGELLLHGRDVAGAVHAPWTVSSDAARHVVRALLVIAPLSVDRERANTHPATVELRVKGLPPTRWCFDDRGLTIEPSDRGDRVDCHVRMDPATLLLVSFGRVSAVSRALRGKALSWGGRPLLALKMTDYFVVG